MIKGIIFVQGILCGLAIVLVMPLLLFLLRFLFHPYQVSMDICLVPGSEELVLDGIP